MKNTLSFEEFKKLAMEHYNEGGDSIVECWDQKVFDEYVAEFGAMTKKKALYMFKVNKSYENDIMGW